MKGGFVIRKKDRFSAAHSTPSVVGVYDKCWACVHTTIKKLDSLAVAVTGPVCLQPVEFAPAESYNGADEIGSHDLRPDI